MLLLLPGCANYWKNRGRDAKNIMEVGITTSKRPCFAFQPGAYFNITPLGVSYIRGSIHGLVADKFGTQPMKDFSWGVLLWGGRRLQLGEFDPHNPCMVSPAKVAALTAAGKPLPTEVSYYNEGILAMALLDNAPPPKSFFGCRRNIHLGWIGIFLGMHADEMGDFLLGWTTLDIMGDDLPKAEAPAKAPEAPAKAPEAPAAPAAAK
jgi:hypothetical protein